MIAVHLAGPHAIRSPLSYPALQPLWAGRLALESDPEKADLLVFAHFWDLAAAPLPLIEAWRRRRQRVLVLSEEPFWDSLWSPDPLARELVAETALGALPVVQLNHQTSRLFDFDRIPYVLLTDPACAARYARLFARNAAVPEAEWPARFAARPLAAAFMAEKRVEPFHDVAFPAADLIGLCRWRTRLALAMPGRVERSGIGWTPGPSRFELDDWHGDKIARLDGRARIVSAVENTHHPAYLTEKLFDAFACAARPAYWASPRHRIARLGLPAEAWVNLHGLAPDAAAAHLAGLDHGRAFAAAFRAAQATLAALFGDPAILAAERQRLAAALLAEIEALGGA